MQNRRGFKFWFLLSLITLSGLILSVFLLPIHTASAQAYEGFPAEPILRLETGMHTAPIRRIDIDRDQRFLISGSDDKTVRIWELKTGRLLRTLRVPLGEGNLGKVEGVAISPDGASVATGGWTGSKPGTNNDIYVYDRESGEIRHVIGGLPNVYKAPEIFRGRQVLGGDAGGCKRPAGLRN